MSSRGIEFGLEKDLLFAFTNRLANPQTFSPFSSTDTEKELDPRVKRTRQLLIQAFIELLREKDFQSLTVQDIAERATVNRVTFYAHFEDKYALHAYIIRESFQQMLYSRISVNHVVNEESLRHFILTAFDFFELFHNHCTQLHKKYEPLIEGQVQILMYEFLLTWFKQLKSTVVEQPEISASAISWAIFGVGIEWSCGDKKSTAEETANIVLSMITNGLLKVAEPTKS